jgi:hypothetical protein
MADVSGDLSALAMVDRIVGAWHVACCCDHCP